MHGIGNHGRRAAEHAESELQGYKQHVDDAAQHRNTINPTFTSFHFLIMNLKNHHPSFFPNSGSIFTNAATTNVMAQSRTTMMKNHR